MQAGLGFRAACIVSIMRVGPGLVGRGKLITVVRSRTVPVAVTVLIFSFSGAGPGSPNVSSCLSPEASTGRKPGQSHRLLAVGNARSSPLACRKMAGRISARAMGLDALSRHPPLWAQ